MKEELPIVSVIIPTRDRVDLLLEAVQSVIDQTIQDWELLIIDDGSKVDVSSRLPADPRIRLIRNHGRRGPSAARNVGIRNARGRFIAFLDDDDLWMPHKLEMQLDAFSRRPELGLCGGGCDFISSDGSRAFGERLRRGFISYEELCIHTNMPGSTSNAMVRAEVFDQVGCFDEDILWAEDWNLWMRIAKRYQVLCVESVTARIRVHRGERPNLSVENIIAGRARTLKLVENPHLRRMGWAWSYYRLFSRSLDLGRTKEACGFLVRSFATWPLPIRFGRRRLVPAARSLLKAARAAR